VYPAAALGVVYDPSAHRQRFLRNVPGNVGLTDDILSLAVTPNGEFVAIGESGKRASIVVFSVITMRTVAVLTGHKRGVTELAFSNDGELLVSVGLDDEHRVSRCRGCFGVGCAVDVFVGVFVGVRALQRLWRVPVW
jgi:microtubule-associated protein-like 6